MIRYTLLSFFFLMSFANTLFAQDDELKELLEKTHQATNDKQKVDALFNLADYYFLNNLKTSDSLAFLADATAESSRDRALTVNALLRDAERFLLNPAIKENVEKAKKKGEKAIAVSRQTKDPELMVDCYNFFARTYRVAGESDKAIKANNDAVALLADIKNDSLKIYTYNSLGKSLRVKSDMLNAFKAYLNALTIAEETNKSSLIIYCYHNLQEFYVDIENFEKAKDYAFKALAIDEKRHDIKAVVEDYFGIAKIYSSAKDVDMGAFYFNKMQKIADSLHSKTFSIEAKLGKVNMYLNNDRFKEGYDILKYNPEIFNFFNENGMQYEIDKANGYIQMMLGHYDSSFYYYRKGESANTVTASAYQRFSFYTMYSLLFKAQKQWAKAIEYQQKAREIAEGTGDLDDLDGIVQSLDSLYFYSGDFKSAYKYQMLHQQYGDSLRKLREQKDILGLEIDNENKRTERAKVLEEQELNKRHNLQYMGITAAIGAVFIFLVTLGLFKVSASVVKATGFFAFIFLFEFIILILDNQIHHLTHGEPWKVLLIKIFLIAMLLPFHHWLEEKVIHFLIEHRLLLTKRLDWLKVKKKEEIPGAH